MDLNNKSRAEQQKLKNTNTIKASHTELRN